MVESVLGMNFNGTKMNSSQDFEAFMGLHIPTDSLHDVVMFEMERLVDSENSEKNDQRWTDGSKEGNPLVDELENIIKNPDESLAATTKMGD